MKTFFENNSRLFCILWLALVWASCQLSLACRICAPSSAESPVDQLLNAKTVVLAKEHPERPYTLVPVETLKGSAEEVLPLFIDTLTRQMLISDPDRTIVIVEQNILGRNNWIIVGVANIPFAQVVREIVASKSIWNEQAGKRIEYFGGLLKKKDLTTRQLARLEIAKAPYGEIRKLKESIPPEELRSYLSKTGNMEWRSLYIILLGLNAEPEDYKTITQNFRFHSHLNTTGQLAAWATAFIEINETKAIKEIENLFHSKTESNNPEIKEIITALSVQGTGGHTYLRDRIVKSYKLLLQNHPDLMPVIIKDLIIWERNDLTEPVKEYLSRNKQSIDVITTLRLRAYLNRANDPN